MRKREVVSSWSQVFEYKSPKLCQTVMAEEWCVSAVFMLCLAGKSA